MQDFIEEMGKLDNKLQFISNMTILVGTLCKAYVISLFWFFPLSLQLLIRSGFPQQSKIYRERRHIVWSFIPTNFGMREHHSYAPIWKQRKFVEVAYIICSSNKKISWYLWDLLLPLCISLLNLYIKFVCKCI